MSSGQDSKVDLKAHVSPEWTLETYPCTERFDGALIPDLIGKGHRRNTQYKQHAAGGAGAAGARGAAVPNRLQFFDIATGHASVIGTRNPKAPKRRHDSNLDFVRASESTGFDKVAARSSTDQVLAVRVACSCFFTRTSHLRCFAGLCCLATELRWADNH